MHTSNQTAIITACIDKAVEFPCLAIFRERFDLARDISAELKTYPKPIESQKTPIELSAAYCYASTARNALELALLGFMPYYNAFNIVNGCLDAALSLLVDNKA